MIGEYKAMVISVGGSAQPIITSICTYQPEFVSFLASQQSSRVVSDCWREAGERGMDFEYEQSLADDVNDLLHCHGKAEEALQRVLLKGYAGNQVIVDITGGTKIMTAALTLAAVTHGFAFSYIGGSERTKNGLGVVVNGREEAKMSINPWEFLAVEERKKIALLFNHCQFAAARELLDELLRKNIPRKAVLGKLLFAVEGFASWDLFRHNEALQRFNRARLEELADSGDYALRRFAARALELQPFLEELEKNRKQTRQLLILDLYANAERRRAEGKTDDAVLRLYRLVEMAAQEKLLQAYGIDTSNVLKNKIPAALRDEFTARYRNSNGAIQIPKAAAFRLLAALDDELGKVFLQHEKRFLDLQTSRNSSYLAHGFSSSKDGTYESLKAFVLELDIIDPAETPRFPEMEAG